MNPTSTKTNGRAAERTATNRANARHSTGPRTEAGKKRSSLNALRHGLTGHVIVLPQEDLAVYQRHSKEFFDEYQPKGATEKKLVQTIADASWRLNRLTALETNLLTLGMTEQAGNIHTEHPEVHDALALAAAFREQSHELEKLSIYEARLARHFEKALKQLREFQSQRRRAERSELADAAELLEMHKEQGLPYDPAADGFVFSTAEIETHIRRHTRRDQATEAAILRANA